MNYYERIQKSIDYIEERLTAPIDIELAAREAYMSISNFYRMFYALVGYTIKDYIRTRRLCSAAQDLLNTGKRIIDIAVEYQFESQEAFTRAFKSYFKVTPGKFKMLRNQIKYVERVNLMDKYFEANVNDDKYPDIKVLKELKPMRVAYYHAYCDNPELAALNTIFNWAKSNNLLTGDNNHRFFGFDKQGLNGEHGYEFWMTVDEKVTGDGIVGIKNFKGGKYAVTGTSLDDIMNAWKRLVSWLQISKYEYGDGQCLEEHLLNDNEINNKTVDEITGTFRLDLYMPIK